MAQGFFDTLGDIYCSNLTSEDHAELAKFASDFKASIAKEDSVAVRRCIDEIVSGVKTEEEYDQLEAVLSFFEKTAAKKGKRKKKKKAVSQGLFSDPNRMASTAMFGSAALTALGAGYGIYAKHKKKKQQQEQLRASINTIARRNPELFNQSNLHNTERYFDMITTFSPTIAGNPDVAGNFLINMNRVGPPGMDLNIVKELASLERDIRAPEDTTAENNFRSLSSAAGATSSYYANKAKNLSKTNSLKNQREAAMYAGTAPVYDQQLKVHKQRLKGHGLSKADRHGLAQAHALAAQDAAIKNIHKGGFNP